MPGLKALFIQVAFLNWNRRKYSWCWASSVIPESWSPGCGRLRKTPGNCWKSSSPDPRLLRFKLGNSEVGPGICVFIKQPGEPGAGPWKLCLVTTTPSMDSSASWTEARQGVWTLRALWTRRIHNSGNSNWHATGLEPVLRENRIYFYWCLNYLNSRKQKSPSSPGVWK